MKFSSFYPKRSRRERLLMWPFGYLTSGLSGWPRANEDAGRGA